MSRRGECNGVRTTDDFVGPAIFLPSEASNFVNGHVLYVDGGILPYIGKQPIHLYSQIDKRIPVYCSAEGKSLIMDMNGRDIETMFEEQTTRSSGNKAPETVDV